MRVVFVFEYFARQMGYLANCLPKYLARTGAEVHVIATDLPPYYSLPSFRETYGEFLASSQASPDMEEEIDGFRLHTLPHRLIAGKAARVGGCRLVGLDAKLARLRPDVVQSWSVHGWVAIDCARAQARLGYTLFTANHIHRSVYPIAQKPCRLGRRERWLHAITRGAPGWWVARRTAKCYCISEDCLEIARDHFHVPQSKLVLAPLGTDPEFFWPLGDEDSRQARAALRHGAGASDADVLCVYTGRFTEDKAPLLLANAVARLRAEGLPYRALFVGSGPQQAQLECSPGAVVRPFVPFRELGAVYRAADIGVWPTQESMSMVDAAACGLPIVVNDTVTTKERVEGNGLLYRLGDEADLARALRALYEPGVRRELGGAGAQRVRAELGWDVIAGTRAADYADALGASAR